MKLKINQVIALVLALTMIIGVVGYSHLENIFVDADDSNAYKILEIVKAPQYQQLSYLDNANRPYSFDDMSESDRLNFLSKYPITTNLDTFETNLLLTQDEDKDVYSFKIKWLF